MSSPKSLIGQNKVEAIEIEKTRLVHGRAEGTGETETIPADLVVACIGYRSSPIPGVPFDERAGRFANDEGRIRPGLYCVGWARRGPTGTIGTNRPDGYEVAEQVAAAMPADANGGKPGGAGLDALLAERGVAATSFADWRIIEQAEEAHARAGSPREKMVRVEHWLRALGRPA
jgi:NADPH-dependent glutamate synthase beta subunit-like oxidoreductase